MDDIPIIFLKNTGTQLAISNLTDNHFQYVNLNGFLPHSIQRDYLFKVGREITTDVTLFLLILIYRLKYFQPQCRYPVSGIWWEMPGILGNFRQLPRLARLSEYFFRPVFSYRRTNCLTHVSFNLVDILKKKHSKWRLPMNFRCFNVDRTSSATKNRKLDYEFGLFSVSNSGNLNSHRFGWHGFAIVIRLHLLSFSSAILLVWVLISCALRLQQHFDSSCTHNIWIGVLRRNVTREIL